MIRFGRAVVAFVACGSLLLLFVLWTEYAYLRGVDAGYDDHCASARVE